MSSDSLAFWNSQLQNSIIIPDFEAWPPRYQALSADAVARHGAPERIATGDAADQAVWRTATGRPGRALIFIHGGYWRRFAAADFAFVADAAAAADATFWNVDYRLMPGVRLADVVEDTLRGVARALEGAEEAIIVGHSAGGHLAVEAALRAGGPVRALVPVSGIYELAPLASSFIQEELDFTAEELAAFSPQARAAALAVPVHLYAGADETVEFRRQSARLYDAIVAAGGTASLTFVPDRHHNAIVADLADPASGLTRRVVELLAG